jgi:hypothetical protein
MRVQWSAQLCRQAWRERTIGYIKPTKQESVMNCLRIFRMVLAHLLIFGALATACGTVQAAAALQKSCKLQSAGNKIKRVIYIVFDNVHLRRDNPKVPSDLEQMPNLLNFLLNNGTVSGNYFTPLISHTAHDIVTALTERSGIPIANSYGFFRQDGSVGFQSSFLYWTATSADGEPEMANEFGKVAPAPWVAFTRAGCDVGAFSVANIEFESIPSDVNTVFGSTSPEGIEANNAAMRDKANADFLGIAIHCAQGSSLCGKDARPDLLPDEPGGYSGFNALYGNYHVQPVISPTGPTKDLDGNVIQTAARNPGSPEHFYPAGDAVAWLCGGHPRSGRPVVYDYIADAHDRHTPVPPTPLALAKPIMLQSSNRTMPRSESFSPACRPTALQRTPRYFSLLRTKTTTSPAARQARQTATGSMCDAPTQRSAKSILIWIGFS